MSVKEAGKTGTENGPGRKTMMHMLASCIHKTHHRDDSIVSALMKVPTEKEQKWNIIMG